MWQGLPESQEIDAPDVFTDQPHILAVTLSGECSVCSAHHSILF